MTETHMDLSGLLAKQDGGDFLRGVAEAVPQPTVEADGNGPIGAGRHERADPCTTRRNGYRKRALDTRLGTLNLKAPKPRQGNYAPAFWSPAHRDWSYVWLNATYPETRQGGRIVSGAAFIAVAAKRDRQREIVGLGLGPSEAEPFWMDFPRGLHTRGLEGTKLAIGAAHRGHRAAIVRAVEVTWQRCRGHWMRPALAHVSPGRHTVVADRLRPRWPKLAALMGESEHNAPAYMSFPRQHRKKLHSTDPIERPDKEVKRRADVVGIVPDEASIARPVGAGPFEQNDEWQTASR